MIVVDSITHLRPEHAGGVAVCGSHGGLFAATVASRAGLRAVVLSDAGVGLDGAGVAGILALADMGMAAAGIDARRARIGSGEAAAEGPVGIVNAVAEALGVRPGMTGAQAAALMARAPLPRAMLPEMAEARRAVTLMSGLVVQLLDSASLAGPADDGAVLVTGSHGARLAGGAPVLKARARLAVFHDAGGGPGDAGHSRLPALEAAGIGGATVRHDTARIGEAASLLGTGVIARANAQATAMGLRPGARLRDALEGMTP